MTATTSDTVGPTTRYWRASGFVLMGVAVLGLVLNTVGQGDLLGSGFLAFDGVHDLLHVGLAAVALALGFGNIGSTPSRNVAKIFGLSYLALGAGGFFPRVVAGLHGLVGMRLELGENLIHLALGAWGLYAGFGMDQVHTEEAPNTP